MDRFPSRTSVPSPEEVRQLLADSADPIAEHLTKQEYAVDAWEERSDEFGPSASLTLSNPEAHRDIDLTLGWVDGNPVVTVMITRTPRQSVGDDFFLSQFIQKVRPGLDRQSLLIDPKKPIRQELGRVLGIYEELLRGPAAPILRGEAWETGHYTDWTL